MKEVLTLINELEQKISEDITVTEEEISNVKKLLDEKIDTMTPQEQKSLSQKLTEIRRKKYGKSKWQMLLTDMSDKKECKEIYELLKELDELSSKGAVVKEELEKLEEKYRILLPTIRLNLSIYDIDRTTNEIEKKFKILNNRLKRVLSEDKEDDIENILGEIVKKERMKKRYSLKDLENISGISASYLNRIELGERHRITLPVIVKIAKALDIDMNMLLSKLKIINPTDTSGNKEVSDFETLILNNNFYIRDKDILVTKEEKQKIIEFINYVLDCKWVDQLGDAMNLSNRAMELKKTLIK